MVSGKNFELQILIDLHVLRSAESENHIFSVWSVCISVSVCLSVCLCVCVISMTQKQITAESTNLAFYIWVIGRCYLKRFIKSDKNSMYSGIQKNFNTLKPMEGISC